jgi:hypothetical protein
VRLRFALLFGVLAVVGFLGVLFGVALAFGVPLLLVALPPTVFCSWPMCSVMALGVGRYVSLPVSTRSCQLPTRLGTGEAKLTVLGLPCGGGNSSDTTGDVDLLDEEEKELLIALGSPRNGRHVGWFGSGMVRLVMLVGGRLRMCKGGRGPEMLGARVIVRNCGRFRGIANTVNLSGESCCLSCPATTNASEACE